MRPTRLTVQAFGPYVEQQVVDFVQLSQQRMFLIAGPTGSGKTTLLDAICFALFGETSGGERDPRQMRSHLAHADNPTRVTLDFTLGPRSYRVTRAPEQPRARRRGSGNTTQRAESTLWRVEHGRPMVLASQSSLVTAEVERLLGFGGDQFRQTVVLPQGQFRRLLLVDSRQRQQMLEALFQTEIYRSIEDALRERARGLRQELGGLLQQQQAILEQTEVASPTELARQVSDLTQRQSRLDHEHAQQQELSRQANHQLATAREATCRMEQLREAQATLEGVQSEAWRMDQRQHRAERARRAAGLVELERRLQECVGEDEQTITLLLAAEADLDRARRGRGQSHHALERELAREPHRQQLQRSVSRLEQLQDELDRTARELARLEQAEAEQARQCDRLRRAIRDRGQRIHQATFQLERIQQAATECPGLRAGVLRAEHTLRLARRASQAQGELAHARKRHHSAEQQLDALEQRLAGARQEQERLELALGRDQAAQLARRLAPGEPCPVCGSLAHPRPAVAATPPVTDDDLRQSRLALSQLEQDRDAARDAAADAKLDDHRAATELVTLQESLGGQIDPVPLERNLDQLRQQLAQAEQTARGAEPQTRQLERLRRDQQRDEQQQAQHEQQRLQTRVELDRLPARSHPPHSREALEQQRGELQRLMRRLERTREAAQVAGEALAARQEAERQARRRSTDAIRHHLDAEQEFAWRLTQSGFDSVIAYREARLEPPMLEQLELQLQQYREQLSAARQRHQLALQAAPTTPLPDLHRLQQEARLAEDRLDQLARESGQVRERLSQQVRLLERLEQIVAACDGLEQRQRVAAHLAEVATGSNPLRTSLQRFVLGSLLDLVLEAASRRLRGMSRGRYDLHRASTLRSREADLRRAGGLDLTVHDSYCGQDRPVHTLSGGESFLAALSLALGLADVVAANAGGIRLETLFIDEGFGSLDPESFELAYRTLVDLERGERLIGIISHVPELREWIDQRVEVVARRGGSTLRQVG